MMSALAVAIEALEFVREAGSRGTVSLELVIESMRHEARIALAHIEKLETARRRRERAAEQASVSRRPVKRYEAIYTRENAPAPLHELYVREIEQEVFL